jgi:hypothetical protein
MGRLRFIDSQARPPAGLDVPRRTVDELQRLVPPFERTFQASMAPWRLDGHPRTARRYTTYQHSPLPTPADRRLCILVDLNTYSLQVGHERLCGMGQSKAHQWLDVWLALLQTTRRRLGDAPSRSLAALAHRLGGAEAEAPALVGPTPEPPTPAGLPAPTPVAPWWSCWHRTAPRAPPRPASADAL